MNVENIGQSETSKVQKNKHCMMISFICGILRRQTHRSSEFFICHYLSIKLGRFFFLFFFKINSWVEWCIPVVQAPGRQEAKARSRVQKVARLQSKILNKQASFFFYISSPSPFPDPKIGNLLSILSFAMEADNNRSCIKIH